MRGYCKYYVNDVQREMGVLFQAALVRRNEFSTLEEFVQAFLKSKVVWGIEHQHPHWLGGSSGAEWYMGILDDLKVEYTREEIRSLGFYHPDQAFWCGWVIAYYQWLSGIKFKDILRPGLLDDLWSRFILHEADISVTVNVLDQLLDRSTEGKEDPFNDKYMPDADYIAIDDPQWHL